MLLHVRRLTTSDPDAHGNTTEAHGTPQPWHVRGMAPGAMVEPGQPNRDASVVAWTVYADKSDEVPGERDLVVFDGDEYPVEGRPQDWTLGPWQHPTAGVVVELRRVEG